MITVKSCNEFGRTILSRGIAPVGGTRRLAKAIAKGVSDSAECYAIHIVLHLQSEVERPTVLFDAITAEVKAMGVERIKLTIHTQHHTVQVGVRSFSPLI